MAAEATAAPAVDISAAEDHNLSDVLAQAQVAVSPLHQLLDEVEKGFADLFAGHVPQEHARIKAFVDKVRMVIDQAADSAPKNAVEDKLKAAVEAARARGMV